ncbi:MAG TPA: DUF6036 family nucleotidyltransferase [Candidatus Nanoarchaeia archaeon]|nr:DUF6036 family nucleotidyltransferase [Candidatus Nanoarchaeia archaeon]
MISIDEQQAILLSIARELKKQVTAFAVGGTAMMFLGLKNSTLDIDLVFESIESREEFIKAAGKIGFSSLDSAAIYGKRENIPEMLKLDDFRLDLFVSNVIDFIFSEEMQKRAKTIRQFEKNLILKIADVHDIILMKCATSRLKDIDDAKAIIQTTGINWNLIVEEAKNQLSLGKERAILDLGSFLEKLGGMNLNIPNNVLNELWALLEKQIIKKKGQKIPKRAAYK